MVKRAAVRDEARLLPLATTLASSPFPPCLCLLLCCLNPMSVPTSLCLHLCHLPAPGACLSFHLHQDPSPYLLECSGSSSNTVSDPAQPSRNSKGSSRPSQVAAKRAIARTGGKWQMECGGERKGTGIGGKLPHISLIPHRAVLPVLSPLQALSSTI